MYYVSKRMEIAGSHHLKLSYPSKCENLHGHRWRIVVELEQEDLQAEGTMKDMVLDFGVFKKAVRDVIEITTKVEEDFDTFAGKSVLELTKKELMNYAKMLEKEMKAAAKDLQFERAAILRDKLLEVRAKL